MKYGLEKEFFLKKGTKFILVPNDLPKDECGWLLELRTTPSSNINDCIDELMVMEYRTRREVESRGYTLVESPVETLPQDLVRKAMAAGDKGVAKYKNYLGYEYHNIKQGERTASVHISFTNPLIIQVPREKTELWTRQDGKVELKTIAQEPGIVVVNQMFDYMPYFLALDKEFQEEIKSSSRVPGMYEIKFDGRIEYRSLPNNIDLYKLGKTIKKLE